MTGAYSSILVCGLGRTGLSLARHWAAAGARVAVADTRESPPCLGELRSLLPDCRFETCDEGRMAEMAGGHDAVALSPGLSPAPFRSASCRVLGEVGCFLGSLSERPEAARPRLIAVTGTNGKSTLVSMLDCMLRACGRTSEAIGNIGRPMLDALADWGREGAAPEFAVLELSSFQLEVAPSVPAEVSVALNVSEDHLDRHGTMGAYAAAKARIYRGAACAAVNRSDPACVAMERACPDEIGFAPSAADAEDGDWRADSADGAVARVSRGDGEIHEMSGAFAHPPMLSNALAAMAVSEPLGIPAGKRLLSLRDYAPLPHRMNFSGKVGGVTFYDDSKATNVAAAAAAIARFGDGMTVVIAGGDAKGQEFGPLAEAALGRVAHFVLIGADAARIEGAMRPRGIPCSRAEGMSDAVGLARSLAPQGGRVLLSPACSSLDMYDSYAARGEDFARSVRQASPSHAA